MGNCCDSKVIADQTFANTDMIITRINKVENINKSNTKKYITISNVNGIPKVVQIDSFEAEKYQIDQNKKNGHTGIQKEEKTFQDKQNIDRSMLPKRQLLLYPKKRLTATDTLTHQRLEQKHSKNTPKKNDEYINDNNDEPHKLLKFYPNLSINSDPKRRLTAKTTSKHQWFKEEHSINTKKKGNDDNIKDDDEKKRKKKLSLLVKPNADSFEKSNFKELYINLPFYKVTEALILKSLPLDTKKKWDEISTKNVNWGIAQKCVYLWTLGDSAKIHDKITSALIKDCKRELKKYMPVIRGINKYLVHKTVNKLITYRGSHITDKQFSTYRIGTMFRTPQYIATSIDINVAQSFMKSKSSNNIMLHFEIPTGCMQGRIIENFSKYQKEKEFLIPPYTCFTVTDLKPNKVTVAVAKDNLVEYKKGQTHRLVFT